MQLRPRHFALLAIVIGLFIYNIVRHRHDEQSATSGTRPPVIITAPRINTPAWAAFDRAANLRDAPESDFQTAFKNLNHLLPLDPNQTDGHIAAIKGCLTWLEFYRHSMAQTNTDPQMNQRSLHHIDDCVEYHLDTGA